MDANFMGIAIGLVAIAITIFFGLRGLTGEIKDTLRDVKSNLSTISERVVIIQETVKNVWDVAKRSPYLIRGGTVERKLKNLGSVSITAEPHLETTDYSVKVEKAIIDVNLIVELSKKTGLEEKELEMFGGKIPLMGSPLPYQLEVVLPSTDSKVCTRYMSLFLRWLDSEYYQAVPKIEEFEEEIEV